MAAADELPGDRDLLIRNHDLDTLTLQLMAHNSLYITSRDQTKEQIEHHEDLMAQIRYSDLVVN